MNVAAELPFSRRLIVEHDRGLRQERNEAMLQPQFAGDFARGVRAVAAPAVQSRAGLLEGRDALGDRGDREYPSGEPRS